MGKLDRHKMKKLQKKALKDVRQLQKKQMGMMAGKKSVIMPPSRPQ